MLLAGDIGGTKTRLGLFEAASPRPTPVEVRTYTRQATSPRSSPCWPHSWRASHEHVISGPGLVNIHRCVHRSPCAPVDPDAPDAAVAAVIAQPHAPR